MQLAYVINERLKETAEDAEREKALKEVAKKKAQASEKARILAEKRLMEMDVKLGGDGA